MYEASGTLRLEEAEDPVSAVDYFSALKILHAMRWKKKDEQGVFANPVRDNFHRSLVESRFSEGEIQLLRVRNDKTVIGYLYNLVWRNHVYVIQTGFESAVEKGLMPGYVVHAMAIEHNRKLGMRIYDHMYGDEHYKKLMCKRYHELLWVALQRRRLRFDMENLVLSIKRSLIPA